MKVLSKLISFACISIIFFSCKKDISNISGQIKTLENNDVTTVTGDCERRWFGIYSNGTQTDDTITQKTIIKNGVAYIPPVDWYNYHSGIYYNIPLCHEICGDAIRFEARIKNPKSGAGAVSNYNVALQLFGKENLYGSDTYSEVYFTADQAFQSYTHIWIGKTQIWNLPELVHSFEDFETVAIELKGNTVNIFREGQLAKSIAYNDSIKIGRLKRIGIGFKGSGTTDWVKLYNSKSGAQIMQEDFDVDGKSNVKWY